MSWGNKLLITFIVFGLGISYLVYRSTHVNYELVENDYYKKELRYQQVIDDTKSANNLKSEISIEQSVDGIHLQLPSEMKDKSVSGDAWFYCAYDSHKDRKYKLQPGADGKQVFPLTSIVAGEYTVKVSWSDGHSNYYAEKKLTVL